MSIVSLAYLTVYAEVKLPFMSTSFTIAFAKPVNLWSVAGIAKLTKHKTERITAIIAKNIKFLFANAFAIL